MTTELVIEGLRGMLESAKEWGDTDGIDMIQTAISIIDCRRWTPCSKEELPEYEVLCCNIYGDRIVGYVYADRTCDTGFSAESDGEDIINVTAWMPLPEPYKEGVK